MKRQKKKTLSTKTIWQLGVCDLEEGVGVYEMEEDIFVSSKYM